MTDETTRNVAQPPDGQASPALTPTPAPDATEISETIPPVGGGANIGAPVLTSVATGGRGSRARWAIGLGVAGLAVAVVAAAVVLFGSRPTPTALTYIPANAVMVAEVRPDLPGDQLQKLGNLLAHFPGFADQSTLPDKLDESLAQLFSRAGEAGVDYRADIKPWLSGPAFIALLPPGDNAANEPLAFARGVASLTTTGTVSCDVPFKDQATTHEAYQGVDLVLGPNGTAACVVNGQQALLGETASVRAALDAHAASTTIDRQAGYQKARASLQGDQLATVYISGAGYVDLFETMAGTTPGLSEMLPTLRQAFPEWIIEGIRAEDDAAIVEVAGGPMPAPSAGASPGVSLRPIPPGHASAILAFAPANTVAYVEAQGTGVVLLNSIDQLRAFPMYAEIIKSIEQEAKPGEVVGWIQDAGVIVTADQAGAGGGLVLLAADAAKATERAATLKGLIALAGFQLDIDSADSEIGGAKVTTYTIANLGSMLPPGSVTPGMEIPAELKFSIATKDKAILLGTEPFVTAALSIQAGTGLADQAGYKSALARGVPNSQTTMYVAIRDIIKLVEPLVPAEERTTWDTELKPYFAPFQSLTMTVSTDPATGSRGRFVVTLTNP